MKTVIKPNNTITFTNKKGDTVKIGVKEVHKNYWIDNLGFRSSYATLELYSQNKNFKIN